MRSICSFRYVVWLAVLILLSACGGGGGGGGGSNGGGANGGGGGSNGGGGNSAPTVTGVVVTPTNPSVRHGDPLVVTAHLTLSDGSTQPITNPSAISWFSDNRFVLDVTPTAAGEGQITAHFRGQATVRATYQTFQSSTVITITPVLERVIITDDPSLMPPSPPGGGPAIAPGGLGGMSEGSSVI